MASLEDVKSLIEKKQFDGLFDVVAAAVEAEKTRGINESRKANKEAEGMRKFKKAFESMGYEEGIALEEFTSSVKEKLEKAQSGEKATGELSQLQQTVKKLQSEIVSERERREGIQKKARDTALRSTLLKDLTEKKVIAPDMVVDALIARGQVRMLDDDKTVEFVDNDIPVDYSKGISSFVEKNKHLISSDMRGGSGSAPNAGGGEPVKKTVTRQQLDTMEPKARIDFIKSGGEIRDQA